MNPLTLLGILALAIVILFCIALVSAAKYAEKCEEEIIARKWEERTAPDGTKYLWPVEPEEEE